MWWKDDTIKIIQINRWLSICMYVRLRALVCSHAALQVDTALQAPYADCRFACMPRGHHYWSDRIVFWNGCFATQMEPGLQQSESTEMKVHGWIFCSHIIGFLWLLPTPYVSLAICIAYSYFILKQNNEKAWQDGTKVSFPSVQTRVHINMKCLKMVRKNIIWNDTTHAKSF